MTHAVRRVSNAATGRRAGRMAVGVALTVGLVTVAACTDAPATRAPVRTSEPVAGATPSLPAGAVALNCTDPIDVMPAPTGPHHSTLDAVALDTTSTLQAEPDPGAPHRLFAKSGLLVHAGRTAELSVPAQWAARVSIEWGNHAHEWTTTLFVPACPHPSWGAGQWLAFPGGFSVDRPACIPLRIRVGVATTTVHVSVGARC